MGVPCSFTRKQFPVKPAFAITVNKSQGQSMKHVGIDLQSSDCFSHGQLYVALSRVTSQQNLRLIAPNDRHFLNNSLITNVVWTQVLLPRAVGLVETRN